LITGLVSVLLVSVSVLDIVGTFTHSTDILPADTLAIVVSLACPNSILPTPIAVDVDAVNHDIGSEVQLVSVQLLGVPNAPPRNRTLVPHDCNVPLPLGTRFIFILVLLHVAVCVTVPVPPACCR